MKGHVWAWSYFEFDEVCMRCGRLKCMTELILRCPCWKMRLPKRKEK